MDIVHFYTVAVRGYHYYKQFLKPIADEELSCLHWKFNLYDGFAVKAVPYARMVRLLAMRDLAARKFVFG